MKSSIGLAAVAAFCLSASQEMGSLPPSDHYRSGSRGVNMRANCRKKATKRQALNKIARASRKRNRKAR